MRLTVDMNNALPDEEILAKYITMDNTFSIGAWQTGELVDDSLTGLRLTQYGFTIGDKGVSKGAFMWCPITGDIIYNAKAITNNVRSFGQFASLYYQITGEKLQ